MRAALLWLVPAWLLTTLLVLLARPAFAAPYVVGPKVVVVDGQGQASFTLRNDAVAPVRVDLARVEGAGGAPISASSGKLVVTPKEVTIPPRGAQAYQVRWDGPHDAQLYGHVVLRSEGHEIVVAVQSSAARGEPLRFVVVIPLLLAVAAAALSGRRGAGAVVGAIALVAHGALVGWALTRFSATFDAERGNDGLQLLSRTQVPWGTWLCAIDGPGLLGLLVALAITAAAIAGGGSAHGALFLLAGASLVCTSWDTTSLLLGFALLLGGALLGIGPKGVGRTLLPSAVGLLLLGSALRGLSAAAPPHLSTSSGRFALTELARVDWVEQGASAGVRVFGASLPVGAVVCTVLGLVLLSAAPAAGVTGALATSIVRLCAGLVLVRLVPFVQSQATLWAAPGLAWAGAASLVAGALLVAVSRGEVSRLTSGLGLAQVGAILLGVSACTPQGLAGAMAVAISGSLGIAGLAIAMQVLERRLGTVDLRGLGGLFRDAPTLALCVAVALGAACLAPGTAGFTGGALALGGAFPLHRAAMVVGVLGLAVVSAFTLRLAGRLLTGKLDPAFIDSPRLEPFGGHIPELRRDEAFALFVVLAPAIALAFGEVCLAWLEVASRQLLGGTARLGIF